MTAGSHPIRKGDIRVADAGFDEFEVGLLSVARHFIVSFAAPATQSWTGWWKVDPVKARKATHVVLVHNAHDRHRAGDPDRHGQSFMVATIRDVAQDEDGRWLIQFDEFADTDAGVEWPGYRNPVTYADSDELLGQLNIGEWEKMVPVDVQVAKAARRRDDASMARMEARATAVTSEDPQVKTMTFGQIIDHHRSLLARDLGLDPAAVRISIDAN